MRKTAPIIWLALIIILTACGGISPVQLTCEYMENPGVVDVIHPRLAWINVAAPEARGQQQTAWQVRVATSTDQLKDPDLWDSGKVPGDASTRITYNGKPLLSRVECWWQVRVWDQDGRASDWSEPAFWRMGILNPQEWRAQWIGAPWDGEVHFKRPDYPGQVFEDFGPAAPYLRKNFSPGKKVKNAVAFVTGLGYFEFYVNGQKAGDDLLVPNTTNYTTRPELANMSLNVDDHFQEYKVMYLAYDVTRLLQPGTNTLGAILGNGFYNPRMFWCEGYGTPRFIGQLHLTYEDGTEEVVVSDATWKVTTGPIVMNMVYYGETYDARLENAAWCNPELDDSNWENAGIKQPPVGRLAAHTAPTDKVMSQIKPVGIKKLDNGNYLVDFGKEISGWVKLVDVEAPAGHQIDISFNSNLYSGANRYVFGGTGPRSYAPRFNWFVFSAVEIANWPGVLKPESIVAEEVYTNVPESASFETSNSLLNQINEIWKQSQKDNMHGGIASDCPHRERNGYTGDGQVACATVLHNFDASAFYQKWIGDMRGAQNPETGYVPNGAPWQPGCGGGVAWGAAICIMPWEFYLHTGSLDMLSDNYTAMKEYLRYMQTWVDAVGIMHMQRAGYDGSPLKWFNLGEWVAPGNLPPDELVHTFYYWYCTHLTSLAAQALGLKEEGEFYEALASKTRQAFYERFYDAENATFGNAGGNIFALKMGVPKHMYDGVKNALERSIKANKGHLDTGIFGTRFFFEVLSENGMHHVAYEAMVKTDEPGYGRWVELGSTTTREQWDEGGSHNHPMFGGGLTWLYRNLAGMKPDAREPGYKHIIFRPEPLDDLSFVKYYNNTPYGKAGIHWRQGQEVFEMDVTVPVGSKATVHVPVRGQRTVQEDGKPVGESDVIRYKDEQGGYFVFEVQSGTYRFTSR
jgi:alpha-L-rhamnosidase